MFSQLQSIYRIFIAVRKLSSDPEVQNDLLNFILHHLNSLEEAIKKIGNIKSERIIDSKLDDLLNNPFSQLSGTSNQTVVFYNNFRHYRANEKVFDALFKSKVPQPKHIFSPKTIPRVRVVNDRENDISHLTIHGKVDEDFYWPSLKIDLLDNLVINLKDAIFEIDGLFSWIQHSPFEGRNVTFVEVNFSNMTPDRGAFFSGARILSFYWATICECGKETNTLVNEDEIESAEKIRNFAEFEQSSINCAYCDGPTKSYSQDSQDTYNCLQYLFSQHRRTKNAS